MVTGIMGCQQRVWNVVLVMDTLLMSMTLPLLVVDGPNIDASMTDEGTNNVLLATCAAARSQGVYLFIGRYDGFATANCYGFSVRYYCYLNYTTFRLPHYTLSI